MKSLTAWVDKILVDSKGTEWRLRNFSDAYNITDFQKFYNELLPHVTRLKMEDSDLFEKLATTFEQNSKKLSEAMEERFFYSLFWSISLELPFLGRSATDLIAALKQIHSNSMNLSSSLAIFRS